MKILRLVILACMSALVTGCIPIPISEGSNYDDKVKVSSGGLYYFPWPSMGSEWCHIKVFGRRYSNPRGSGLCYLEIPEKNALLFVTDNQNSGTIHLVDLTSHKERHFPAYSSLIGLSIGGDFHDPKEESSDYEKVESVTGDIVVISAAGYHTRSRYIIDFKEPKLIREERDSLVYKSGTWKHGVFEGGKRPENWGFFP